MPNQKQANADKIISRLFLAYIFIILFQYMKNTPNTYIHCCIFINDVEFLSSREKKVFSEKKSVSRWLRIRSWHSVTLGFVAEFGTGRVGEC